MGGGILAEWWGVYLKWQYACPPTATPSCIYARGLQIACWLSDIISFGFLLFWGSSDRADLLCSFLLFELNFSLFCGSDFFIVQVYSLQLVVEMRSGEVRSLRQQLAVANQQVSFLLFPTTRLLFSQEDFNFFQQNCYFCLFPTRFLLLIFSQPVGYFCLFSTKLLNLPFLYKIAPK